MPAHPKLKPLRDVRYFESVEPLGLNQSMPGYVSELYAFPNEAVALGWRIGLKCEELGISIGQADHLYVCFTPSLPVATVELTEFSREPWHRFVVCGLSPDFNGLTTERKVDAVTDLTFKALHLLAPEATAELNVLIQAIRSEGEALRVKLKGKETKKFLVRVEQTVPALPRHAEIFVHITNKERQHSAERKVAEVRFYDDAPCLIDRIAILNNQLTIHPRKSFRASLTTSNYPVPFQLDLAELGIA